MMQKILYPVVAAGLIGLVTTVGLSTAAQYDVKTAAATPLAELAKGDQLRSAGDYKAALAAYDEAARKTGSAEAWRRLAGMQMVSQDYAASIRSFQTAIGLDPDNAQAFVGLAVSYLHSQNYTLAEAALGEAKLRKPEDSARIDQVMAWVRERTKRMDASMAGGHAAVMTGSHPAPLKEGE